MLSWPLIRNTCLALLLLPLGHFTWVVSSEHARRQQPGPEVWQPQVDAYTREAQSHSLPDHPILVTGGRGARLWTDLERLLAPRPVLMRGLGDAVVDDITHHYNDLIGYYQPETLVLLLDNNEFRHRDDKTPGELLAAVQALASTDAGYGVTRQLYLIGPVKTPYSPQNHERIDSANALLADWAASEDRVIFIDPRPALETVDRQPDGNYFRPGGQYLNDQGYLRLGVLLRAAMEANPPRMR